MYNTNRDRGIYIERQARELGFSMDYEHSHNYYEIYYLLKGKVLYSVNNFVYQLMPGDVFIVLPNEKHYTHYDGNSECERINVYCSRKSVPTLSISSKMKTGLEVPAFLMFCKIRPGMAPI